MCSDFEFRCVGADFISNRIGNQINLLHVILKVTTTASATQITIDTINMMLFRMFQPMTSSSLHRQIAPSRVLSLLGSQSSKKSLSTATMGSSKIKAEPQQQQLPTFQSSYNKRQQQIRSYTIPVVLESGATGERSFDIYSRLLRERIICVHGEVTDQMASVVTAQLLFLEAEDPDGPLYMYINSPGGSVTAGMAMYDTMRYIRPKVHTIAMGQAASMGSLLLAGGSEGCRSALPNATIMLHQPSGGAQGMASDIQIRAQELLRLRSRLNELYVFHTTEGRKHRIKKLQDGEENDDTGSVETIVTDPSEVLKEIESVMDRDTFMTAEQAMRFGIIDEILIKREEEEEPEE